MNFIVHNKIRASNIRNYNTLFFRELFQYLPPIDCPSNLEGESLMNYIQTVKNSKEFQKKSKKESIRGKGK